MRFGSQLLWISDQPGQNLIDDFLYARTLTIVYTERFKIRFNIKGGTMTKLSMRGLEKSGRKVFSVLSIKLAISLCLCKRVQTIFAS